MSIHNDKLEAQIGCGKDLGTRIVPLWDEVTGSVPCSCGAYMGDNDPDYCDACWVLIDQLEDEDWETENLLANDSGE